MSNVPSTAVIQVKQGIGDVIWHLPFVRAIAATTAEGAVTFLTLPSTRARELLEAEPSVAEVIYFEHNGSELQRGLHLARLVTLLRKKDFRRIWILDRTIRPALAACLASIPERIGPGDGAQRFLTTNPPIEARHFREHAIDWLRVLLAAMDVPLASTEPELTLPARAVAAIAARYHAAERPWTVLGLGSTDRRRDWSDRQWIDFIDALRRRAGGTVFLIGGPANGARAARFIDATGGTTAINACELPIVDSAVLLAAGDLYVGPDSGPMNVAAAVGTPSFGLFGVNQVLNYSRFIHAIEPDDGRGQDADGMARISPAAVLRRIEPYLGVVKG